MTSSLTIPLALRRSADSSNPSELRYGLDRELEYAEMVADGVVMMRSRSQQQLGPLLAGFWCSGPDWEAMTTAEIAALTSGLQDVLKTLDFGWMVHAEIVRVVEYDYRKSAFSQALDAVIEESRAKAGFYYVTRRALFLTRAPTLFEAGLGKRVKHLLMGPSTEDALDELSAHIERFERAVQQFGASLGRVIKVRRMRHQPDNDELLQALNLCVRHVVQPAVLPDVHDQLSSLLSDELTWSRDAMVHAGKHLALVKVDKFPSHCRPLMLRELTLLASDVRWSIRFIPLDHRRNQKLLDQLQRAWLQQILPFYSKLFNVDGIEDRNAVRKSDQVAEALSEFNAGNVRYGLFTQTLIFRGDTQEEADAHAQQAVKVLQRRGVMCSLEQMNKMAAWIGSQPGHGAQNPRKTPMHTGQVANFLALTEEYAGESVHPCPDYEPDSPPLMQVRNLSGGKFNLNLHAEGKLGHTVVFGPSQHGKTFALAYLNSQFMKHANRIGPAQAFFLDVGRSMVAFTLARTDGRHYQLGGEAGIRLCPLAELDTAQDIAWASVWLEELFAQQGVRLDGSTRHLINDAVRRLAACSSSPADRSLTHLLPHLLASPELQRALVYYTSGPGGEVLNGDAVEIERANFTCFELGPLKQYGDAIAVPTRSCIWRVIEKRCDGRPTMLTVDELMVSLPEERDQSKMKDLLNTLAKRNCVAVLATQQLDQVSDSKMANAVFECCPTKILLPNRGMSDDMRALYMNKLSMTPAQVQLLKSAEAKRFYMVLQKGFARLFTFDAGPVEQAFFGARSEQELRLIAQLVDKHKEDWPAAYLVALGLHGQAAAFHQHRAGGQIGASA